MPTRCTRFVHGAAGSGLLVVLAGRRQREVDAGLVAVGVRQDREPVLLAHDDAARVEGCRDPLLGVLAGYEHVEVEPLPRRLMLVGLLEPQVGNPTCDVTDVVADGSPAPRLLTSGEQRRP